MNRFPLFIPTPKRVQPRSTRGFTLIELLMVIAIILILAGITFGISRGVYNAQARAKAKAELATISQAIEQFKLQYGDYPWHDSGGAYPNTSGEVTNTMLMYALTGRLKMERQSNGTVTVDLINRSLNNSQVKKNPSFIDPTKFSTSGTSDDPEAFLDPWGNPYRYWYKWENSPNSWDVFGFHLYSIGADSKESRDGLDEPSGVMDASYRDAQNNIDNIYAGE
ncbi:MAG TPA: hypothetical protein DCX06_13525 [Opitutae bacterium]|nr:hypothetical protein [Opitutae bacterium]